jgi:beta-lactamase regulating signal transducer with metallopeptidase domain
MIVEWPLLIVRTSVALAFVGACVWLLMRWQPLRHPLGHRWAWGLVLAQGLMFCPWSLTLSVPAGWVEPLLSRISAMAAIWPRSSDGDVFVEAGAAPAAIDSESVPLTASASIASATAVATDHHRSPWTQRSVRESPLPGRTAGNDDHDRLAVGVVPSIQNSPAARGTVSAAAVSSETAWEYASPSALSPPNHGPAHHASLDHRVDQPAAELAPGDSTEIRPPASSGSAAQQATAVASAVGVDAIRSRGRASIEPAMAAVHADPDHGAVNRRSHTTGQSHTTDHQRSPQGIEAETAQPSVVGAALLQPLRAITLGQWLCVVWAVGVVVVLGQGVWNYRQLQRALQDCQPARPKWASELQQLCLELGLNHDVRLQVHQKLGPFLCWTPAGHRVVVPVRLWNRLSHGERLAVLHHELCHLRRGDLWKAAFARLIVALHWFNPLAWMSAKRFDESAEWACDLRMAQESPARMTQLAKALLSTAQVSHSAPALALAVTGGPLFQRIRRLLSHEQHGDSIMQKCVWTGTLIVLAGVGVIRLSWTPPVTAQENEVAIPEIAETSREDASDVEPLTTQELEIFDRDDRPATAEADDADDAEMASRESDKADDAADQDADSKEDADDESDDAMSSEAEADSSEASDQPDSDAVDESQPMASSAELLEFANRIVVADNPSLKKFVELLKSPAGQILMADQAALAVESVQDSIDPVSRWQMFTGKHFHHEDGGEQWIVNSESEKSLASFVQQVQQAEGEIAEIARVLREVAPLLAEGGELVPVLKRFLQHESAAAFIYRDELRAMLHPGKAEMEEQFREYLVRASSGEYVIRPARRAQVEEQLEHFARLQKPLERCAQELEAWSKDLIQGDPAHDEFAAMLTSPEFVQYVVQDHWTEESRLTDEEVDHLFYLLEEATTDTAAGLKLNTSSGEYAELLESMERFKKIWAYREGLAAPLHEIADRIQPADELHTRLQSFLKTDFALLSTARKIDYLPVEPAAATLDWLGHIVTKNEAGRYDLTVESADELSDRMESFFRDAREARRRGRLMDEFAAKVSNADLQAAMSTLIGKLLLQPLIEESVDRPDVDGVALWVDQHFEETPEGLVLRDGAQIVVDQLLTAATDIESELTKQDF